MNGLGAGHDVLHQLALCWAKAVVLWRDSQQLQGCPEVLYVLRLLLGVLSSLQAAPQSTGSAQECRKQLR